MNSLIQTLQQFADCYEGDPRGLASDFELLAGISMNELTQTLSDEIEKFKEFEREELKQEYLAEESMEAIRLQQLQYHNLLWLLPDLFIMTYIESVLNAADDAGFVTSKDAKRLLREHNVSPLDAWIDLGDDATDASKLLEYLGYWVIARS